MDVDHGSARFSVKPPDTGKNPRKPGFGHINARQMQQSEGSRVQPRLPVHVLEVVSA
jgi:hypothetical protein